MSQTTNREAWAQSGWDMAIRQLSGGDTTIEALIVQASTAIVGERTDGRRIEYFNPAHGTVNGHEVEVRVVEQMRRTTSRAVQIPSFMFKVDGKRVSKANLADALA